MAPNKDLFAHRTTGSRSNHGRGPTFVRVDGDSFDWFQHQNKKQALLLHEQKTQSNQGVIERSREL